MPILEKYYRFNVNTKDYVDACSPAELRDLLYQVQEKLALNPPVEQIEVVEPKFVGPATGHNGDLRRCAMCGYYKSL